MSSVPKCTSSDISVKPVADEGNGDQTARQRVSQSQLSHQIVRNCAQITPLPSRKHVVHRISQPRKLQFCVSYILSDPGAKRLSVHPDVLALLDRAKQAHGFTEGECLRILQILSILLHSPPSVETEKAVVSWFMTIQEELGEGVFSLVSNPKCYQNAASADAVHLLKQVIEVASTDLELSAILMPFFEEKTSIKKMISELEFKKEEAEARKYPEKNLDQVIAAFRDTGPLSRIAFP